ncbi:MAG: hypothetical protein JWQ81_2896 [Amycolatopsis sp.]|uniref:hypothetical protein n=1 Tax=Amycolatopsis sp. TaxID=37632 RepID=UPI0026268E49|nr:hypothetical protein [Amycolatopsis sp.]MCU1682157.1 hypothetical protein [Amycolatopsis sp.]
MSEFSTRPEILKLARVLSVGPERFAYLENVDPEDLKRLRGQVTDTLFDANLAVLQRMALASRLLPVPLLAKIGEKVFGPLLCARIAGVIDASRGVDVAKRLPTGYLADVAVELDPRRASAIISGIPLKAVVDVAAELTRREDWITIGRFVGHLADRTVVACLDVMPDVALLQVAFVLDDKSRLDHVIGLLPPQRLPGVLRAAADHDLMPLAEDLLAHLSPAHRARFPLH